MCGGVKHEREAWTSPVLTRVCTHVGLEMPSHHTRRYTPPRGGRRACLIHNAPSVNSWPSQVRREDSRDAAWRLQAAATVRKGASTAPLTTGLLPPEDSVQHLGTCRRRAARASPTESCQAFQLLPSLTQTLGRRRGTSWTQ